MLVELLKPAHGVGPEQARRWLVALSMVPEHERDAVIGEIERRVVRLYHGAVRCEDERAGLAAASAAGVPGVERAADDADDDDDDAQAVRVVSRTCQRDGYTEQVVRT